MQSNSRQIWLAESGLMDANESLVLDEHFRGAMRIHRKTRKQAAHRPHAFFLLFNQVDNSVNACMKKKLFLDTALIYKRRK